MSEYALVGSGPNNDANSYMSAFRKNLDGVGRYWLSSQNDARDIENWLRDGANMAVSCDFMSHEGIHILICMQKWPKYMKLCIESGVKLCWCLDTPLI